MADAAQRGREQMAERAERVITDYSYDALDQLIGVSDTAGNATTLDYDMIGRKTSMSDPDMGAWSYTYDADGERNRQKQRAAIHGRALCSWFSVVCGQTGHTMR